MHTLINENTSALFSAIKCAFERSGIPAAIADSSLRIIWKNNISGSIFADAEDLKTFFNGNTPNAGISGAVINDKLYSFNVLIFNDTADGNVFYAAELIYSEEMANILRTQSIRNYLSYLCRSIRENAAAATNSADEIYDSISCGIFDGKMISENLNIIDKAVLSITKEIVDPDVFFSLLDRSEKDVTMSLKTELQRIAAETSAAVRRTARVTENYQDDIFFRMPRSVFESAVAGMISECCDHKGIPDVMLFSSERTSAARAAVSVLALHSGKENVSEVTCDRPERPVKYSDKEMFFKYICEILSMRADAKFTCFEVAGGIVYKMEFNVFPKSDLYVEEASAYYGTDMERFGTVSLKLSGYGVPDRYPYYDIDSEGKERSADNIADIILFPSANNT